MPPEFTERVLDLLTPSRAARRRRPARPVRRAPAYRRMNRELVLARYRELVGTGRVNKRERRRLRELLCGKGRFA